MQSNSENGAGNSSPKETVFFNTNNGKGKIKTKGQKVVWSHEENLILWEAYIRSRILSARTGRGYTILMKEIWDGKDIQVRSQACLVVHVNRIKSGCYLSDNEREAVERRVRDEMSVVRKNRVDEGVGGEGVVGEDVVEQVIVEGGVNEDVEQEGDEILEGLVDSEINGGDVVEEEVVFETEDDVVNNREVVDAEVKLSEVDESEQSDVENVQSDDERQRLNMGELAGSVNVVVEREEVWRVGKEVRVLTDEEKTALRKFKLLVSNGEKIVIPSLKTIDKRRLQKKVKQVKGLMHNIIKENMSITEVNRVLLVGGYLVAEGLGKISKGEGRKKEKGKPYWQRRVEKNIVEWRKDLGRVEEMRKGTVLKEGVLTRLNNKYDIVDKGCLSVSILLKNKIKAGSVKIKYFTEKTMQHRQNTLFTNNQSQVYKELGGKTRQDNPSPNADEAKRFWSDIWSQAYEHNTQARWLGEIKEDMKGHVNQMANIEVSLEDVVRRIKAMSNWKAPGPDGVQGYWFKAFDCLHKPIVYALQQTVLVGDVPEWMVTGKTALIQKDPAKGTQASNYRPIACLPLMWKLLTGIFADRVYTHLLNNQLLPEEQKGCRKNSRGTKDQLLIDRAVLREAKKLKKNVAMSWIDYKKAYDMVPHSWIKEVMNITGVAENIKKLMTSSMENWGTVLTSNGKELGSVSIRRGIFQGDSFSPLLFVMAMIPLTVWLRKVEVGFRFSGSRVKVNHLLFMDDLKLYGQSENELDMLVSVVKEYSDDIGMQFGLDKCGMLVVEKGVKRKSEGIVLPGGEIIKEIDEGGYKYLGVLEAEDIMEKVMKDRLKGEYYRRTKLLVRSKLYGGNMVKGINAWAVSVIRYTAGIINWSKKELRDIDIKTRKIMTMAGVFHQKGDVDRLYLARKEGGRGMISVEDCVRMEEKNLTKYVVESKERLFGVVKEDVADGETGKEYKKRVMQERKEKLDEKKIHGRILKDMKEVGEKETWQWLQGGYITKSMEGFIMASQEQALRTRWFRSRIQKEDVSPKCRLCDEGEETVRHLSAGCPKLSKGPYKRRHDRMGLRVYWELCRQYGIECREKWFEEVPDTVRKSKDDQFEIWWDRPIETTVKLDHNRPDIVVINRQDDEWIIVEFSVPWDKNVLLKEEEKASKYIPLAKEIRKVHKVSTRIIPIILGSLGTVTTKLKFNLKELGLERILGGLQTSVLIGTHNILRKVINMNNKEKRKKNK